MRYVLTAAALLCSTPAMATGGFECRPISVTGPRVTVGFGHHTFVVQPFQASIREGNRILIANGRPRDPIRIGQSWIDRQYIWLDLVNADATRFEARLRAKIQPKYKYPVGIGTLERGGRTYRVRCIEA